MAARNSFFFAGTRILKFVFRFFFPGVLICITYGCRDVRQAPAPSGQAEWRQYTAANSSLVSNEISVIAVTLQNDKWIGTPVGASRLSNQSWSTFTMANSSLQSNRITAIAQGRDGSIWLGTGGGALSRYNPTDPQQLWRTYYRVDGLPDEFIHDLGVDQYGDLFVATNVGVGQFTPGSQGTGTWRTFTTSDGLPSTIISALVVDKQNAVWVGTINAGTAKYDGQRWSHWPLPSQAQSRIAAIAVDNSNAKWFATWNGVHRLDASQVWTSYSTTNGLADNFVYAVGADLSGNIWFGTDGGLSKFDGTSWTTYRRSDGALLSDIVTAITVDRRGNLWIGTPAGLHQFNEQGIR